MNEMISIKHICFDGNKLKIYVNNNDLFQYIYRAGAGISWNNTEYCFESIDLLDNNITEFFVRTINSVMSEIGISLLLNSETKISNLQIKELEGIINSYFCFKLKNSNYPIVFVHENGLVSEIKLSDRLYLQTKYKGGDGDAPYIKENYSSKTYDGRNSGYCFRKSIPSEIQINIPENINMYMNLKQILQRIEKMNYEIDYKEIGYIKILENYEEKNA